MLRGSTQSGSGFAFLYIFQGSLHPESILTASPKLLLPSSSQLPDLGTPLSTHHQMQLLRQLLQQQTQQTQVAVAQVLPAWWLLPRHAEHERGAGLCRRQHVRRGPCGGVCERLVCWEEWGGNGHGRISQKWQSPGGKAKLLGLDAGREEQAEEGV